MNSYKIIFENQNVIVVDKPSGWLTVPSRHEKNDERKVVGRELEKDLKIRLFPVHRLDFEVSGIVLFAKDVASQKKLNSVFEKRDVKKIYEAWTQPRDFSHWPADLPKSDEDISLEPGNEFLWKCKIMRGKRRSFESPHGDESLTKALFEGILSKPPQHNFLKWRIEPLTGRSHQIRFELSRHGFPILGDALYGSKIPFGHDKIALRAVSLIFSQKVGDFPTDFKVEGL